jgi:peptidoglycan biosynthesis protein MviN/MurJ (putative lipid II flippase)
MRGALLAVLIAVQLISVLAIQLIVIRNVGIGAETDSFIAGQTVAVVLAAILQACLQSIWLPKLSAHSKRIEVWKPMLESAISQSLLLSITTFSIFVIASALWLPVLFSAFDSQQISRAKTFFILFSISSILNTASYQLTTALRAQDKFLSSEALNAFSIIVSLPVIYYFAKPGALIFVAAIIVFKSFIIFILQLKLLSWPSFGLRQSLTIANNWNQMRPVLIGASLYKTLPLLDRSLVALAPAGMLTIFNLAQTGVGALSSVLERSVCVPITAKFGRLVSENHFDSLRKNYRAGVVKISIIAGVYVIIMILTKEHFEQITTIILNVSSPMSTSLWWMCIFLVGYLHVAASGTLVVAVIHSLGDTNTPVKIGIMGFILSLPLKVTGFYFFGVQGVVFATSIHYIANMLLNTIHCERLIYDASSRFRKT